MIRVLQESFYGVGEYIAFKYRFLIHDECMYVGYPIDGIKPLILLLHIYTLLYVVGTVCM